MQPAYRERASRGLDVDAPIGGARPSHDRVPGGRRDTGGRQERGIIGAVSEAFSTCPWNSTASREAPILAFGFRATRTARTGPTRISAGAAPSMGAVSVQPPSPEFHDAQPVAHMLAGCRHLGTCRSVGQSTR